MFKLIDCLNDPQLTALVAITFAVLSVATIVSMCLHSRLKEADEATKLLIKNLAERIRSWWILVAVFGTAVFAGPVWTLLLFAAISFCCLREFLSLAPTQRADHRSLFLSFFIVLPLNYLLIAMHWYGLFAIFIPVYAFLAIPLRSALAGDNNGFLARAAQIQWALLLCIYFISYAPALLLLLPHESGIQAVKLLVFFVLVVQSNDVMQYVFGKWLGKHKIAPAVSPNKTLEGFIGGTLSAAALGGACYWLTPFSPWQAGAISLLIALAGFAGGIVMSAIKRDRGVKDYGQLIAGHGGMLDRVDSICFAAPVFFHTVRYFFG